MSIDDSSLVFLVSQPRSGSSMLQHILAAHSEVATRPEPWFLLPLAYMTRPDGTFADYNAEFARLALQGFVAELENGADSYVSAVQGFALRLYGAALAEEPGARYFLDKTPRYYFILDELRQIFPKARIVLLVRNPLAVLASIVSFNFDGNWLQMIREIDRRHDLVTAPALIAKAAAVENPHIAIVKYEDLVLDSEPVIRELCRLTGIGFQPGMLEYGGKNRFKNTTFVDGKSVYEHQTAVTDYLDAWKATLQDPQHACLSLAYLDTLDDETLTIYGENRGELERTVLSAQPTMQRAMWGFRRRAMAKALKSGYDSLTKSEKVALDSRGVLKRRAQRLGLSR
jgi:hypothetical protein